MMDLDPKLHTTSGPLLLPSSIRGDLGAFASANSTTGSAIGGLSPVHGSQQLHLGQPQRFDEDSNLSLIKVWRHNNSFC